MPKVKPKPKGIFCLEGLWSDDLRQQTTVRPILELLDLNSDIPYIHSDCATLEELRFYLEKWAEKDYIDYPILYLAFHGHNHGIWLGENFVSLDEIALPLMGKCKNRIILLASCSTVKTDIRNLKRFLKATGALALCGYQRVVPWITSTAFELMLLATLQQNVFDGRGLKAISQKTEVISKMFSDLDFRLVTR